jgi:hypothetical protein
MADNKYGRLFTEDDARKMVEQAVHVGISVSEHAEGDESARDFDADGVFDVVVTSFTPKFPEDEPLFVLRGQDEAAAGTIDDYGYRNDKLGANAHHLESISEAYSDFIRFQVDHPDRVKVAD